MTVVTVDGVVTVDAVDRVVAVDGDMVFSTQQCKNGYSKLTLRTCTSATLQFPLEHIMFPDNL